MLCLWESLLWPFWKREKLVDAFGLELFYEIGVLTLLIFSIPSLMPFSMPLQKLQLYIIIYHIIQRINDKVLKKENKLAWESSKIPFSSRVTCELI